MTDYPTPTLNERKLAKSAHDILLINLIVNHVLLFSGLAALGPNYLPFMVLIPVFSVITIAYLYQRSQQNAIQSQPFIKAHWRITLRSCKLLATVLLLGGAVIVYAWYSYSYLEASRGISYTLAGGLGVLPIMIIVIVLIVLEASAMHRADDGLLPDWARQRFLN